MRFAYLIVQNLDVHPKTRDEVLYLVDLVFALRQYKIANGEVLCIACIVFVLKFEDDFNSKFPGFLAFVKNDLKIDIKLIKSYEVEVLSLVPNYFVHLPSFREIIQSIVGIMNLKRTQPDLLRIAEETCLDIYLNSRQDLSISSLFVDPVVAISSLGGDCSIVYEKLRAVLVSQNITLDG